MIFKQKLPQYPSTTEHQSSYRQIMKATSIFGGVQIINILISVIRSKFVAVLLGPTGMGILGLLNSTLSLIGSFTNFGLGTSAVKDIAASDETGNQQQIGLITTVLRRMVWMTGLLGSIITAVFSPWLSELTFGNKSYTIAFIWISVTLILNQLTSGQLVILQGLRKLQFLAKANVVGSVSGLFLTIPLYYFWGENGIVPAIIVTALISLALSWYFGQKIKFEKVKLSFSQTLLNGRNMLKMGFMISLSGLFTIAGSYIIRIFISRTGGVEEVGLYNAGFAILNTYVGLIFTAMATDYYPRLSAVANDNELCKQTINQQAEIALIILSPILIIFLAFIKWVIILLYSNNFIVIDAMICWAVFGIFFKAASWSIAFIFLAKGNGKLFFMVELISNVLFLGLNILGYRLGGLSGLGISFSIFYLLYFTLVYLISKIKFNFDFHQQLLFIFFIQFGLAVFAFLIIKYSTTLLYTYSLSIILIAISIYFSFSELKKRLGFEIKIQKIK